MEVALAAACTCILPCLKCFTNFFLFSSPHLSFILPIDLEKCSLPKHRTTKALTLSIYAHSLLPIKMGCWGDGILQGDADMDVADEISADAGFELHMWWDTDEKESKALGLEGTRDKLNEGVFTTLFDKYKSKSFRTSFWEKRRYTVLLVVLAMEVGTTISKEQIDYTKSIYRRNAGLMEGGLEQMRVALKEYKNEPYDFEIKGLYETAVEKMAAAAEERWVPILAYILRASLLICLNSDEGSSAKGKEPAGAKQDSGKGVQSYLRTHYDTAILMGYRSDTVDHVLSTEEDVAKSNSKSSGM